MVPINYYIILSAILFTIGALGVLTRRNALIIFMSVELMLNAANLAFVAFARAREVARATLGDALWAQLQRQGYLDVPSTRQPGLIYRLRVGRRIEVRCAPGVRSPWPSPYLCINTTYPLPEEEFFAQLYLYVRDREDLVRRVAAPQPWDQALGRTF